MMQIQSEIAKVSTIHAKASWAASGKQFLPAPDGDSSAPEPQEPNRVNVSPSPIPANTNLAAGTVVKRGRREDD